MSDTGFKCVQCGSIATHMFINTILKYPQSPSLCKKCAIKVVEDSANLAEEFRPTVKKIPND
jgi:hypothetical protein